MDTSVDTEITGRVEAELAVLKRGVVDLIEEEQVKKLLATRLAAAEPLRVKFGMDPSSPDLHVGHAIPLMKLRDLQQLGHTIVLIVGDATAMVGDPSGRNKLRPQLTREDVEANLRTYTEQAALVLDMDKTEVHRNSTWFDRMGFEGFLRLAGRMTVAQMIERDTFAKRMAANEPIGIHEFLYPLMQGWDSVEVKSDLELGGNDQLFNLLRGRDLQKEEGQMPQVCFTTPLIDGLDGRKMSKSYGNAILLTEPPAEMFGKVMSIPDEVMPSWFTLLTRLEDAEVARLLGGHPREAKARLAEELVRFFHGADAARAARAGFDAQFRDRKLPEDIPELAWPGDAPELPLMVLLRECQLVASSSEARRAIEQGGVRLDGDVVRDPKHPIARPSAELLLQVGKRRFARVKG